MTKISERILQRRVTNKPRPSFFYSLKLVFLFLLSSLFTVHGCAVAVIGLGAGAGAIAYLNGKLTKTYESDYHETVRASKYTLERLKIPVTDTISDELKTEIKAKRPDGTPVTIDIVRIDQDRSRISVRTGTLGVWDRRVSEQIQGFIDITLSEEDAQSETEQAEISEEDLPENTAALPAPAPAVTKTDPGLAASAPAPAVTKTDPGFAASAPAPTVTKTDPGLAEPDEKPLRPAQMRTDSAFIIFFEEDSNALTAKSMEKLNRIYGIMAYNTIARLTLTGYSDSLGKSSYNQMISEIRATAVKSYLIGQGVDSSRITSLGLGAKKAIASNKTAAGRRMNRRVEIEITTSAR